VTDPLNSLLFVLGVGFLGANLLVLQSALRSFRLRRESVLTWQLPRPRLYLVSLAVAVGLGVVILYKTTVLHWPLWRVFGEAMMIGYYGAAFPWSLRIRRGIYASGLWMDRGFVRWTDIGGARWRDDPGPTLIAVARGRPKAWRLAVPATHYAEARRLLRDHVTSHDLRLDGVGLHLGGHDEREDL
jgi:hypothetical protein